MRRICFTFNIIVYFKESGITYLENQGLSITIAENTINIIGVESPSIADDLNKSLSSLVLKDTYNMILPQKGCKI